MKKLIALFATTAIASTSAMGAIALSGSASVSYDDKAAGTGMGYDADLTITGTAGATTFTQSMDIDTSVGVTATTLATSIGPLTVSADMYDETDAATNSTTGGNKVDSGADDRSVTVSLAAPIGDANLALDDSGDITVSGTWSGVTVSHTMSSGGNSTTGSASIAGMDVSVTNDDGSTTWSIGTTIAGTAITLDSSANISATFGVTGNTVVVTHTSERDAAVSTDVLLKYPTTQRDAFTTVAISRDLTSGATLAATYDTADSSLTLKASVAF